MLAVGVAREPSTATCNVSIFGATGVFAVGEFLLRTESRSSMVAAMFYCIAQKAYLGIQAEEVKPSEILDVLPLLRKVR